jgi:hypothetical protein
MAFREPIPAPRQLHDREPNQEESSSAAFLRFQDRVEESQEWVLFSPSQAASTATGTQIVQTPHTAGLSRTSEFGSLGTRFGQTVQSIADDAFTEDGELDSLDEGLQAFRETSMYHSSSNQDQGAVLPTHDGLGTFPASSAPIQDQLWEHEQYNPKRKYEGSHRRRSSVQRRLDTIEELDLQISEEKRVRIEQWRTEQSQALLGEIEKETRRRNLHNSTAEHLSALTQLEGGNELGTTSKRSDTSGFPAGQAAEAEPFWKKLTRRFVLDVIGIDEPLLSVIVGETLPEDMYAIANLLNGTESDPSHSQHLLTEETWPDRLLRHVARELGLLVHKLSSHSSSYTATASPVPLDCAGMPISEQSSGNLQSPSRPNDKSNSESIPLFSPTMQDPAHNASWGLEDELSRDSHNVTVETNEAERLRKEREYWERELDIKMVFRFLRGRFSPNTLSRRLDTSNKPKPTREDSIRRADVIRWHHPLVARAHQPSIAKLRRDSTLRSFKRSVSSCASESVRSGVRPSLLRSNGSSRNYWDIGGSLGSGSAVASGVMMGTWGES